MDAQEQALIGIQEQVAAERDPGAKARLRAAWRAIR